MLINKKSRSLAYSVERIAYSKNLNPIRYPCLAGRQALSSKVILAYCILIFTLFLCGCQDKTLHKDTRAMMGTFVEVTSADKEAPGIVFDEIRRIENLLSKYKEDSEISRLNRFGEQKVSPDTFYILQKAKELWQESGGAFDVTVGPLMDIWGFTDKNYRVPGKAEIEQALILVGSDKIIFNPDDYVVKLKFRGMKLDLGAIAKGYAADRAVKKLKERGIKSCLINLGGQVYCLGDKSGKPWNIAVKDPRGADFVDYLKLQDISAATSGDYEQYFVEKDKRYSHILDPRTGFPADSGVLSVTVVAASGLITDSLATSIFVLGKEEGMRLANKFPDVKVKIINNNPGTLLHPKQEVSPKENKVKIGDTSPIGPRSVPGLE
ncbi:MAG: FAD:protein FMN transferase [Candidatus Omnitrophota bacterium]